jgi:hypothetical protein
VQQEQIMLDSDLGDQAVYGAADCDSRTATSKVQPRCFPVATYRVFRVIEAL